MILRLAPVVLAVLLLAVWEIACRALNVPLYFLPPPSAVLAALVEHFPVLITTGLRTLTTALIALAVASVIAQALAVATALSRVLDAAIRPLAAVVQVTPVIAIAPLVIIWFGLDHPQRPLVALATVVAFFPIFSGAATGLRSADPDLERLFTLYGASRWQKVVRLRLPSAIPFLLEGHKVGAGLALIGAVVAEFSAGSGGVQGLAWQILDAGNKLQIAREIAALVVLATMGVALHAALEAVERVGLRWWRGR